MPSFSQRRVQSYLRSGKTGTTTTARGRSCEDLGEYIFDKFPGVELVTRDTLDAFGAAETDLVFTNDIARSGLYFLEPVLIVECKNYSHANVSSADVTYFAARLREKGARSGVLLTTTAISGSVGKAGIHALEVALTGGVTVLVIDVTHIWALTTTESLTSTLMEQLLHFRILGTLKPSA